MFAGFDWLKANKWNLHGEQQSHDVERRIRDIDPRAVSLHDHQNEHVQWNKIDDEHIASPGRHHIEIAQGAENAPHDRTGLHGLDPQVVSEHQCEYRDTLIVVATGH